MLITLRGLPRDIAVSEIRSYIYERCAVGRVLVDDLETDVDGSRRVTVATSSDADALTMYRVLSGERLGVYTLFVEPCQSQDAFNDATGSGQWFGNDSRRCSGQVTPWLADNQGSRERTPSPRPDSARAKSLFSLRPADRALPDWDRSPYPPFPGALPSMDNQRCEPFLPAPNVTPHQPPIFSNTVNTFNSPFIIPEQSPLADLGAPQALFPVNEVHQYGSGLPRTQPQFKRSILPEEVQPFLPAPHATPHQPPVFSNNMKTFNSPLMIPEQSPLGAPQTLFPVNEMHQYISGLPRMQPQFQQSIPPEEVQPFLPAPHATPNHPPIFSNTVNTFYSPFIIPYQSPVANLGAPQTLFPLNEVHQYGSGHPRTQPQFERSIPPKEVQSQFEPPIQPIGRQTHNSLQINNSKNSSLNNIESIQLTRPATEIALENRQPIKGQKLLPKSDKFRKLHSEDDSKYIHYASNIVKTIVDYTTVEESDIPNAKSFITLMEKLIEKRLRKLTRNRSVNKYSISVYRKAFPYSTDGDTFRRINKELSLPKIPIQLKALQKASKNATIKTNYFRDLTKYVDVNLIVDPDFKDSMEENVKADNLRYKSAGIIANQLLKPENKGNQKGLHLEERLHSYLKDLIATELGKFPREKFFSTLNVDVILRLYHENTSPERNRKLIEMAIAEYNAQEPVPYSGIFTIPDQVTKQMQFWPDLHLKPGESSPVSANFPEEEKNMLIDLRINYASIVIGAQVYVQNTYQYLKFKETFSTREAEHLVRSLIQERLQKLVSTDTSNIVSSRSLVALYRSKYREYSDRRLLESVNKDLLKQMATEGGASTEIRNKLAFSAASVLAAQTVYGRMLTMEERRRLTWPRKQLLLQLQAHIQKNIKRIMDLSDACYHSYEQVCEEYRIHFPVSEDVALVWSIVKQHESSEHDLVLELSSSDDEANLNKNEESKSTNNQETVSESTLAGWREACVCQVAKNALRYETQQSELNYAKIQIARKIVREQVAVIHTINHEAASKFIDVYLLYRKFYPLTEDAALEERVNRESATDFVSMHRRQHLQGWQETYVRQVVDKALYRSLLNTKQRERLSCGENEKGRVARAIVREQIEDILKDGAADTHSDLHRRYRELYPPEEDAALKERVSREVAAKIKDRRRWDRDKLDAKDRRSDPNKLDAKDRRSDRDKLDAKDRRSDRDKLDAKDRRSDRDKLDAKDRRSDRDKLDANDRRSDRDKLEGIADTTWSEWSEWIVFGVAEEALFGNVLNATERKILSKNSLRKAVFARAIVREQLEKITAKYRTEVYGRLDLYRLYRKVHPKEKDTRLKKLVKRMTKELKAEETKAAASGNKNRAVGQPVNDPTDVIDLTTEEMEDNGESTANTTDMNTADITDTNTAKLSYFHCARNENQAVSRPVSNGNQNERSSGGPTDDIILAAGTVHYFSDLSSDEMEDNGESTADTTDTNTADITDTNTEHIKDHSKEKDTDLKELAMCKAEEHQIKSRSQIKTAASDNENQAVRRPVSNGNPNEGSSGPTDDINLAPDTVEYFSDLSSDEMENHVENTADIMDTNAADITDSNTDHINDYMDFPYDEIDVDAEELEDY